MTSKSAAVTRILLALVSTSTCAPIARASISIAALTLEQQAPESIYAPPEPPREDQGINEGAVHIDLTVSYLTDYVYRGLDRSETGGGEDRPNFQFDGAVSFDLGKLPHPFVGAFVNVYDADPVSQFQEFRPTLGFDWTIKPLTFTAGNYTYIYPDRDDQNTNEVYVRLALDDSFLFGTTRPVLSPYIFGAYDYDLYNGWYFEAGVKHDFLIEDTGITLTFLADVAYVMGQQLYLEPGSSTDQGFQHYDVGVIGSYSLNTLLNLTRRYGEYSLQGYLFYTDGLSDNLRADTQLWGGAGINFKY